MKEFRRVKRRRVEHEAPVVDIMTDRPIGRLSDLSEFGMLLSASQPPVSDALYQLRFRFVGHGVDRDMEVGAHGLWTEDGPTPARTGFRFIDVAPADLALIRDWVNASDAAAE